MRSLRLKNGWCGFLALALLVIQVAYARAQDGSVAQLSLENQIAEKMHGRESSQEQLIDSSKESSKNPKKNVVKEIQSGRVLMQFRGRDERINAWKERVDRRQKMRELNRQRTEQGELPSLSPLPRADLRSFLQSPKREQDLQERAMRQELKMQMEKRRQVMQELRERRAQMTVEDRRALRKQILDASQGMPPPPRR
jgi:multidrug efflux pump subunit AcrB